MHQFILATSSQERFVVFPINPIDIVAQADASNEFFH